MFNKILIANRGEIAVRIIQACKEMGISTVAIFSEADSDALHVQLADESVCVGPNKSKDSYLNIENILSAACILGVQAIHPGFGFLSENSSFASMCEACNIKFIGPASETIDLLGNKVNAKKLMIENNVPVIPGSEGAVDTYEDALSLSLDFGFPIMIKASAGGGGRGIRIVRDPLELKNAFYAAKSETKIAFGDDTLYMEKLIENPRHVEVQVLFDEHGNGVHLGERDCSLQLRNQKVLEEAPSFGLPEEVKDKMASAALKAARAANYSNAGTVEFLYDGKTKEFYFMEMNTRIQVEHPVTEMITSIDIVKEQISIAAGNELSFSQEQIKISGHSIECRINAESLTEKGFIPSPGMINYLVIPSGGPGLRIDSSIFAGYKIPPFYDSMIAKVIVKGKDRNEAIAKMKRALSEFVISGIETNIDFQLDILNNPKYMDADLDTGFLEREILK